ncbi:MAG: DUF389 domain-containing protein [Urechidicola sp.]|nr:DUF389 domain-containing protein [Urechidicola sp.]
MEENSDQQSPEKETSEQENSEKFSSIWKDFKHIMVGILEIRTDTDKEGTIQDVKDGISMKGHTAWVLIFSILIASIGLNISSPAVVIGAMLISPLMGPILGVGLSIAINDIDTLRRSFVNLGVMIGLSVLTSFIFFKIPIFQDITPEIKARTAPDVRDVFIAIAGGLALIMAISRRSKQTNTIAGVAIATALMPPLCVAGYGLAVWEFDYFFGAMFLFTINTIFIALATFLIVKFLRFPMVKYINSAKRKRISQLASVVALIIFSYSVYEFVKLYQEDRFKNNAKHLIVDMKKSGIHIFEVEKGTIDYKTKTIKLILYGNTIEEEKIKYWKERLAEYDLENANFIVEQSANTDLENKVKELTDLYSRNQEIISSRDEKIQEGENQISSLEKELKKYTKVPFEQISKEAKINYSGLKTLSYANYITTNFKTVDTVSVFNVRWHDSISNTKDKQQRLGQWLKTRLELDTIKIVNY